MKEPYQKPISFVKSSYIYLLQSSAAHCAESWENRNGEKDVENVEFFHKAKRNLSP